MKDVQEIINGIANAVAAKGGRALLVGGSVRDMFMGKDFKDLDLEIYGIILDDLTEILSSFGKVSEVGKSFGVLKIKIDGFDLDISLPRTESKTGEGHKGFAVKAASTLSFHEAFRRRDFTINAIGMDVLTGEIIDPFNGLGDLLTNTLRIVDVETFVEDPLRLLRAAQFVARFNLTVDPKSMEIMRGMLMNE